MRTLKIESLPSKKKCIDGDFIILHASFQALKDCVEQEKLFDDDLYNRSEKGKIAKELYDWWMVRKDKPDPFNKKEKYEEDTNQLLRLISIRESLWV